MLYNILVDDIANTLRFEKTCFSIDATNYLPDRVSFSRHIDKIVKTISL